MVRVLVADDDQRLLKMLQRTLMYEGLDVVTAANGQKAVEMAHAHDPDVIILDWMMPEMDGMGVLAALRQECDQTPVLMLTARDAIEDRVDGLENGADDYLVKPFSPAELVARVHALLRRTDGAQPDLLSFADLRLDPVSREVWRGTRRFVLTPTECELLCLLIHHPRQVLPCDRILSYVWGYDAGGDHNIIEVYVRYLRRKMEARGESRLIHTIRGIGYILRESA